jgi:hypothetical protein
VLHKGLYATISHGFQAIPGRLLFAANVLPILAGFSWPNPEKVFSALFYQSSTLPGKTVRRLASPARRFFFAPGFCSLKNARNPLY